MNKNIILGFLIITCGEGADFLSVTPGARAIGLGQSFVAIAAAFSGISVPLASSVLNLPPTTSIPR